MSAMLVVANRLPVRRREEHGSTHWVTSPGGLVAALAPVLERIDSSVWVGWAGSTTETFSPFTVDGIQMEPVPIDETEFKLYYDGFCNATIWPLYHDSIIRSEYHRRWWDAYQTINQRFTEHICKRASANAVVWVHDYQLQLVPEQLRAARPDLRIGYFLHIPFPPIELFLQLPWRWQILRGIMGADVVGFQTEHGASNFRSLVERGEIGTVDGDDVIINGRRVKVRAFPIGVDSPRMLALANDPAVQARASQLREHLGSPEKLILGVDRLDYTKGIARRMQAYGELLREKRLTVPEHVMIQIAEPTRESVPGYSAFRERIDRIVGEINGEHARLGHPAINYIHRSQPTEELVALYLAADVMLVTPVRDGMNLVAKEYVACRTNDRGVLVLSEFAGAAYDLPDALMVNPYDVEGLKDAIEQACTMPADIETQRMSAMRKRVLTNDVHAWANDWLRALGAPTGTE